MLEVGDGGVCLPRHSAFWRKLMTDYSAYFDQFCGENHIEIALSYEMPEGYETAFGSFDVVRRALFLNLPVLQSAPEP